MSDPNSWSWYDLMMIVFATAGVLGLVALVLKIAEWVSSARDELRERYLGGGWEPAMIDIMGVPLWCALEIICFATLLVVGLLILLLAYQAAKDFRDWWHAGDRRG